MEVITFSPDMDLSSKEAGDVFRLKLYGIEYDVKVVGDDEDHKKMVFEILNDTKKSTEDIIIAEQKYCNKEQKTICLCNVSFFIFIERSAGL